MSTAGFVDTAHLRSLLERLERHWQLVDAPISRHLRPGLNDADLDAATESLGLMLPTEARVLLTWHDGVTIEREVSNHMGPRFLFAPLSRLISRYQSMAGFAAEMREHRVTGIWEDAWFPLMVGYISSADIVVDSDVPPGTRAPLGYNDNEGAIAPTAEHSFTDVVQMWVQCFDEGTYEWHPEAQMWDKPQPAPPHLPQGLVRKFYI